ncbi:MAG: cupin domain-containing protein [Rikenellaceae bacterium]
MPKLKKSLSKVDITTTYHAIGEKRVLLSNDETSAAITQIAVTRLKAGEQIERHAHPTMEEYFLIREGAVIITVNNEIVECQKDDFVVIPPCAQHTLTAVTDIELLTIGCATE